MILQPESHEACLAKALELSPWLTRTLATYPDVASLLAEYGEHPPSNQVYQAVLQQWQDGPSSIDDMTTNLRRLRQFVFAWIMLRDVGYRVPLAETMRAISVFADFAINQALTVTGNALAAQHGWPINPSNQQTCKLLVIGMGKLGGYELNVSSDIDLIFVHNDAMPCHQSGLDSHQFFVRQAQQIIAILDDIGLYGRVFRVDVRLRPYGDSGPLVTPLSSLEQYFYTQAREWERYAWIKARVMNQEVNADDQASKELFDLITPFVYRRYLDFGVVEAMRNLHNDIRQEVQRRDLSGNIKLGSGGIREIEFIAQLGQLIRGGRNTELQDASTIKVLKRLQQQNVLAAEAHAELDTAYLFLRQTEHRLQYIDDQQTHLLPTEGAVQERLAHSMGFAKWSDFYTTLSFHCAKVSAHFAVLMADSHEPETAGEHSFARQLWHDLGHSENINHLINMGYTDGAASQDALQRFQRTRSVTLLPNQDRLRIDRLLPELISKAAVIERADSTLKRALELILAIHRRSAYLALLYENPAAIDRLLTVLAASKWAATTLQQHPILLDELLIDVTQIDIIDANSWREELTNLANEHADDEEQLFNRLREVYHGHVFRLLLCDLAKRLSLEQVSDHLTLLADGVIASVMEKCWADLTRRHQDHLQFSVIAFGKLGAKELAYGSDLDLVYLHNDADQAASEVYARLVRKMTHWFSTRTMSGVLFDTDTRLRPDGEAGMLVTHVTAFERYQNRAWVWEQQALTRARFVAGDPVIAEQFANIRQAVIQQPRSAATLKQAIAAMRKKMVDNDKTPSTAFHVKQSRGGLIDIEFIVQYHVLCYGHDHPQLVANVGVIALIGQLSALAFVTEALAQQVQNAYRRYRAHQHQSWFDDEVPILLRPTDTVFRAERHAVRTWWQQTFAATDDDSTA